MAQLVGWHLQTTLGPVPSGQEDSQLAARCEDRHPPEKAVAAQKKTGSRGEDDADAKTHRKSEWYRTHNKEGGGCQEQEESADMQTRHNVKLKAHGLHDPQLHQPQQQVSILDGLVGEEASMIGDVFEIWDKGYKVKKINLLFFLKTSLVYLGTSPDTIGKIS